jgi:hypothetical protein
MHGVFVCALADTEILLQLEFSMSLVMERIDCLESETKAGAVWAPINYY